MTDQPSPSITPTQPSSWFTIRFAKWCWRLIARPLRWCRRHFWKLCIWFITLITLAWQYENWHGRRALEEQRALWIQEYGEMKMSDFIEPSVPDETNFFAAPVFEKFVVNYPRPIPPNESASETKFREAIETMAHAKFLELAFRPVKLATGELSLTKIAPGLDVLDTRKWAEEMTKSGNVKPDGLTEAQWLHQLMPPDENLQGFIDALSRPNAVIIPSQGERFEVGEKIQNGLRIPFRSWSNALELMSSISLRARASARAGDGKTATTLVEILLKFCEAECRSHSLVGTLIGSGEENLTLGAIADILATGCLPPSNLLVISARLSEIDEEKMLLGGLEKEAFGWFVWSDARLNAFFREDIKERSSFAGERGWLAIYLKACSHGPSGWIDQSLADYLQWWHPLLAKDGPGDDLLAIKQKWDGIERRTKERWAEFPGPRHLLSSFMIPALTNIPATALQLQTRRRQLLLAIAAERFTLKYKHPPATASELVPEFLPAIPGDPYAPGQPLQLTEGEPNERYRILSIGPDTTLAFPR